MAKAVVPAARDALKNAGVSLDDVKVIKTHNPFAVNDVYMAREMGLDAASFNNYGSSLIYGHPQGPTGLRLIAELRDESERLKIALVRAQVTAGADGPRPEQVVRPDLRTKSDRPTRASNCESDLLTADCDTPNRLAAPIVVPVVTSARRDSNSRSRWRCSVMSSSC